MTYIPFADAGQLDGGLSAARGARADAMVVFPEGATMVARAKIAQFAIAERLPSMFGWSEYCHAAEEDEELRRESTQDLRATRGVRRQAYPGGKPGRASYIEQPAKVGLVVNLRTRQGNRFHDPAIGAHQGGRGDPVRQFSIADFGLSIGPMATLLTALAISLVAVPLAADAQQTKRPFRIGVLHTGFFEEIPSVAGLKAGLKAMGLEEGRDVTFDIRFTRGKLEEVPSVAASLVKTESGPPGRPGRTFRASPEGGHSKIPVVFVEVGDPLAAGLVASVPRPGGNVTGVSAWPRS